MSNYFDLVASSWDDNPSKTERALVTAEHVKNINFESYASIVDFGSGTGLLGVQLRDTFSQVHLVDSSEKMLQAAQDKIATANITNMYTHQRQDLSDLNAKHSAIVTLMALHHISNVQGFFSDAYRVLEHRGTLIIADLYKEDGSFHGQFPGFNGHNGFDVSELTVMAENAGFFVQQVKPYYEVERENELQEKMVYPLFFFVAQKSA